VRTALRLGPIVIATAIAVIIGSQPATPADSPSRIDFMSVDANKDGKVTPVEAQNIDDLRVSFGVLDINHDETLTAAEYSRWNRADNKKSAMPTTPSTGKGGSAGAQHMPRL
jgi:hypothetical protein